MERVYFAARWGKGTADYINCPMTREEYQRFIDALTSAERVQAKAWEQIPTANDAAACATAPLTEGPSGKLAYFEGCLPIEELARASDR